MFSLIFLMLVVLSSQVTGTIFSTISSIIPDTYSSSLVGYPALAKMQPQTLVNGVTRYLTPYPAPPSLWRSCAFQVVPAGCSTASTQVCEPTGNPLLTMLCLPDATVSAASLFTPINQLLQNLFLAADNQTSTDTVNHLIDNTQYNLDQLYYTQLELSTSFSSISELAAMFTLPAGSSNAAIVNTSWLQNTGIANSYVQYDPNYYDDIYYLGNTFTSVFSARYGALPDPTQFGTPASGSSTSVYICVNSTIKTVVAPELVYNVNVTCFRMVAGSPATTDTVYNQKMLETCTATYNSTMYIGYNSTTPLSYTCNYQCFYSHVNDVGMYLSPQYAQEQRLPGTNQPSSGVCSVPAFGINNGGWCSATESLIAVQPDNLGIACVANQRQSDCVWRCSCSSPNGCQSHEFCSLAGDLYEGDVDVPNAAPVCMCQPGFAGARCNVALGDQLCNHGSQISSVLETIFGL